MCNAANSAVMASQLESITLIQIFILQTLSSKMFIRQMLHLKFVWGKFNGGCCTVYVVDARPVTEQKPHLLLCCRKEPRHTNGYTWTSPHLFLIHTHTFAQPDSL